MVSKRKLRQAQLIELVRDKREEAKQNVGFASRPFVLCGLPVKRPPRNVLLHERRNGDFLLQVIGHPEYGVPFGQDRLVPVFLATLAVRQQSQTITFRSAAEMLDVFGMQQGGSQYRRLVASFQRVFGATFFFSSDSQRERAAVLHHSRFNFMREARIWYSNNPDQPLFPAGFENRITLSEEFYQEIAAHPIPTDLEAAKALSSAPAALDLFMWLSYRCFNSRATERIPLFGKFGLAAQLGNEGYNRPRKLRERLERWLDIVRALWPTCTAIFIPMATTWWFNQVSQFLKKEHRYGITVFLAQAFRPSPHFVGAHRFGCISAAGPDSRFGQVTAGVLQPPNCHVSGQSH